MLVALLGKKIIDMEEEKKYNYVETNKGKTVVKQLQQDIKKFADNLFQHWSVDELSMLQILLNRLDRSMERL